MIECLLQTHSSKAPSKNDTRFVSVACKLSPTIQVQTKFVVGEVPLSNAD